MRIWVDENIPMGQEAFQKHGTVTTFAGRGLKRADILHADALIVRSITKVNADLLEGTAVKFVGTATIGTDHVDQVYLAARGIGFSAAPGCNANSVGEYVTAALLHLNQAEGFSFAGKVMGIVGWGHVGKQVERKALALGMRVLKCDPPLQETAKHPEEFQSLETLLAESDVISLHVPLSKSGPYPTLKMADADFFARLAKPIILINSCRGEVIDADALLAACDAGKIKHLVLDVFPGEPDIGKILPARADLVTPHIAGYSLQGKLNGTLQVSEAFRNFFGLKPEWNLTWPLPANPEITYSSSPRNPESAEADDNRFLHHCVMTAYDLCGDDRRLRTSLDSPHPGKAFDLLRRDYPVRFEFPFYSVGKIPQEKRELRSRLAGLGFRLD